MLQSTQTRSQCAHAKTNKERVTADTEKTNLFVKIFFRAGHLNGQNFDGMFLTEAKSVINVALKTASCNIEQHSLSDFCYMLHKGIVKEKLWRENMKIDQNTCIKLYNWNLCVIKSFRFFTLSLFLHFLNNCLEVDFWHFKQVSVILPKKLEKRRQALPFNAA